MTEVSVIDRRVDWSAIFAGVVLTTAVALILLAFGAGLGLSVTSPYDGEGMNAALFALAAGLWLLWVQLLSFSIGGYVVGRLRSVEIGADEHEVDVRDGMHGLLVWGTGVIVAGVLAFVGLGGATGAATASDNTGTVIESALGEMDETVERAAAEEAASNPEAAGEGQDEREAEVVRKLTVLSSFITAASLLAGAAAAFFSAGLGGKHRDERTHLKFFVLRERRPPAE